MSFVVQGKYNLYNLVIVEALNYCFCGEILVFLAVILDNKVGKMK